MPQRAYNPQNIPQALARAFNAGKPMARTLSGKSYAVTIGPDRRELWYNRQLIATLYTPPGDPFHTLTLTPSPALYEGQWRTLAAILPARYRLTFNRGGAFIHDRQARRDVVSFTGRGMAPASFRGGLFCAD